MYNAFRYARGGDSHLESPARPDPEQRLYPMSQTASNLTPTTSPEHRRWIVALAIMLIYGILCVQAYEAGREAAFRNIEVIATPSR
jgi:hypothetical protein